MLFAVAPTQVDPDLIRACGEDPNWLCEWVWNSTSNETLAKFSDWFVGTPITVLCILLGAWIASHLVRKHLGRLISTAVAQHDSVASRQLGRVGLGPSSDEPDPRRDARAQSIAGVVGSTAAVIIWVIALITVLGEVGIDLGPLIAGAGIAGVALGFGAQSIVKDFLAGLFVLIEDQYGLGDVVDLGEASGTVQEISLRATVLRAQDGTVWHVPNGEIRRVGNRSK
ncbi:MAG: mechanosensitive ion channel domain-containing protein, partial [Ilumatobacteraceae bacterium]